MQAKLKALVVDDEPIAVRRMVRLLSGFPEVQLVGVAENGREALSVIETVRPNLLLLDIQMPGLSGFELLERIPAGNAPAIIFTTAFHEYAAQAFTVGAADFLVKPTTKERLGRALRQAQTNISAHKVEEQLEKLQQLVAELRGRLRNDEMPESELWVRHSGAMVRVRLQSVDWFEAEKDYVRIHTNGRSYLLHGLIGALEQRLDQSQFIRVHRSAIVRLDGIESLRRGRDGSTSLALQSGAIVRVGRKYFSALRAALVSRDR